MNTTAGKKILLIDDDEALRQSLGEQLRLHEEFEIYEADNGTAGLERKADTGENRSLAAYAGEILHVEARGLCGHITLSVEPGASRA